MQDDIYRGMLIPKGSVVVANALSVSIAFFCYYQTLTCCTHPTVQEYGMGRQRLRRSDQILSRALPIKICWRERGTLSDWCVWLRTTVCSQTRRTTPINICSPTTIESSACPGQHVASTSVWIVLATMLSTLKICKAKDKNGQEIIPEVKFEVGLTA
jgi:hypothetical protein